MLVFNYSKNPEANALDQWDSGLILDILHQLDAEIETVSELPKANRAVVLLPTRHNKGYEEIINKELKNISRVVFICLGDEEAEFKIEAIDHPNIEIWVQNPHPDRHDNYHKLGTGYPQHMVENLPQTVDKSLNVYFSGQITHKRRSELIDNLREYELQDKNTNINRTRGFTQGVPPSQYYKEMVKAKVAPCPSGAVVPDSFRLFEALECMAIPIADEVNPTGTIQEYWDWLFGESVPFPKIVASDRWVGAINETLQDWPNNMHHITCWYLRYKRELKSKIREQYDKI